MSVISIEKCCKFQQNIADKIFMDFKYTHSGSIEQINALYKFNMSISMWAMFLENTQLLPEEKNLNSISSKHLLYQQK